MQIYIRKWKEYSEEQKSRMFQRSEMDISEVEDSIAQILEQVRLKGDQALIEYTQRFDKADLRALPLQVQPEEFEAAAQALDDDLKESIEFAINTTWNYHLAQKPESIHMKELHPGLIAGERALPVDSAGLYVPRGRGSFPSMLYMLAVPAKIAGVPSIQIVTPPNHDGSVDAACLYAAKLIGIEKVFRVGGAHAIAALAYGTESIPGVLKVVGPGSSYVTAAKRLLASKIDAGLPAGPSESMIIADEQSDAWNIALDLMVEAEHGSDSCALLLTDSPALAEQVRSNVAEIGGSLPAPRAGFVQDVFNRYGGVILTESIDEAVEIVNGFAPEHLLINTCEPFHIMNKITNAGEILLGKHLPFSAANYSTGANAVLPTGGWAKSYSPVSVRDFIKFSSVVYAEKSGYKQLKEHVIRIADYEGFITHGNALKIRREE